METVFTLNQDLFFKIFNLAGKNPILDMLMVFGADYLIFIIFATCILLTFRDTKSKKALLLILFSFAVGFILLKITELFIYEPRPFITYEINTLIPKVNDPDSFPSGHTLISSIMAISYLYYRIKYAFLMLISAVWVGLSRVFVGVHYPLDIFGGILLGFMAVSISWQLKNILIRKLRV